MSRKTALILKRSQNQQKIDSLKQHDAEVFVSTIFDDDKNCNEENYSLFCAQNNLDSFLLIEEDEEIKHFDSSFSFNYVCLTDGEWIAKPKRIFNYKSNYTFQGMPCILKKTNSLKGIKVDESFSFFKNLHLEKQYKQFVLEIEKWFFHNVTNYSKNVMLRYYAAVIYFMETKNIKSGLVQLSQALLSHPQHSELWCLWGDHLVQSKRYHEAYHIYDTAIIAGKYRNIYDENPVWLKKYDTYPQDMMLKIKKIFDETKVFEIRTQDQVH